MKSDTLGVYLRGEVLAAAWIAAEREGLKPSPWAARVIESRLKNDGDLPDQMGDEEAALFEAKATLKTLGASKFRELMRELRNKNYNKKGTV